MTKSSSYLADYKNPPLQEVVLGVQFVPPKGYQQVYAREVWGLFEDRFPYVEEHSPLSPRIENFGLLHRRDNKIELGFIKGPIHDRFQFLSKEKEELIQFQNDRFLHNWRKVGDGNNPYPRFKNIIKDYKGELVKLEKYFLNLTSEKLSINHCELSYINHIPLTETTSTRISDWINFINMNEIDPDDFSILHRKILKNNKNNPYGSIVCELNSGVDKKEQPIVMLTITVRGIPKESSIDSALNFLEKGNELSVRYFDQITTDFAHKQWRKK